MPNCIRSPVMPSCLVCATAVEHCSAHASYARDVLSSAPCPALSQETVIGYDTLHEPCRIPLPVRMARMPQDIARLYQQCDPARPLQPGDPRYVPFEGVRGEGDLIAQLTNALRWSDVPLQVLFAGHRGGGKSTELLRLQQELAHP